MAQWLLLKIDTSAQSCSESFTEDSTNDQKKSQSLRVSVNIRLLSPHVTLASPTLCPWTAAFFDIYVVTLFSRLLSHIKFISSSMQTTRNATWLCCLAAIHIIFSTLQSCLDSLHIWFCENGMALNVSKSVVILFGTSQKLTSVWSQVCQCRWMGQSFQFLIRSRYSVPYSIQTSQ